MGSAEFRSSETLRIFAAAQVKAWQPSGKPDWLTEEIYREKILPRLPGITLRAISSALAISQVYTALIRAGQHVPHPRHWQSLARLAKGGAYIALVAMCAIREVGR